MPTEDILQQMQATSLCSPPGLEACSLPGPRHTCSTGAGAMIAPLVVLVTRYIELSLAWEEHHDHCLSWRCVVPPSEHVCVCFVFNRSVSLLLIHYHSPSECPSGYQSRCIEPSFVIYGNVVGNSIRAEYYKATKR